MFEVWRRLIRALDRLVRAGLGVFEFSSAPRCLLRVRWVRTRETERPVPGRPSSGIGLELHLWNEHVPVLPEAGASVAWGVIAARNLRWSLKALAEWINQRPEGARVSYLVGTTVLLAGDDMVDHRRLAERLGFTLESAPSRLGAFGEFWENLYAWWLMAAFNPPSTSRRKRARLRRQRMWISRRSFLARYG